MIVCILVCGVKSFFMAVFVWCFSRLAFFQDFWPSQDWQFSRFLAFFQEFLTFFMLKVSFLCIWVVCILVCGVKTFFMAVFKIKIV